MCHKENTHSLPTYSFTCNWYFRTDISEDELGAIISSIHAQFNSNAATAAAAATAASSTSVSQKATVCTAAVEDRRLRNLRKKLDQIEVLKVRQQRGDTLEDNQVIITKDVIVTKFLLLHSVTALCM